MISFILTAVVLAAIAVLIVLPTMLKKNQPFSDEFDELNVSIAKDRLKELKQQRDAGDISEDVFQKMHDELESTLAIDLSGMQQEKQSKVEQQTVEVKNKFSPVVVGLLIPVLAVILYSQLGDFSAATGEAHVATTTAAADNTNAQPKMTMEEAVAGLELRLAQQPDNAEGWFMLARSYMSMKQYLKAKDAYAKTIELVGEEPDLLLRYVDALAMTEGGRLTGTAKPVLDKVAKMLPDNPMVLWLSGTAESQQGNYKKALNSWYKLRPLLAGNPDDLAQLNELISGAESQLGADELTSVKKAAPVTEPVQSVAAVSAAEITVTVDIDPAHKAQLSGNEALFIFAKALQGPPMPLAAIKQTVSDLPLTVTLNDAMAMMPQMKLSNFEQVKVSAVISKSGQPGARPGDLFAEISPVNVFTKEKISLLINQVK